MIRLTYTHLVLAVHLVYAQILLLLVLKIQCYNYMLRLVPIQCITFTKKTNLYYLEIVFVVHLTYTHLVLAIHFVFAQILLLFVLKIQCYHYMLRLVHIQCITFTKKANLYYLAIDFVVCLILFLPFILFLLKFFFCLL